MNLKVVAFLVSSAFYSLLLGQSSNLQTPYMPDQLQERGVTSLKMTSEKQCIIDLWKSCFSFKANLWEMKLTDIISNWLNKPYAKINMKDKINYIIN